MRKRLWSPDEDEKLQKYVSQHGFGNWSEVAKQTGNVRFRNTFLSYRTRTVRRNPSFFKRIRVATSKRYSNRHIASGLQRCGKSCRLRWINYLRPDLKRGKFSTEEKITIVNLQKIFGNSWSKIAAHLPGRTDSDIKNFWHSHFRKKRPQQISIVNSTTGQESSFTFGAGGPVITSNPNTTSFPGFHTSDIPFCSISTPSTGLHDLEIRGRFPALSVPCLEDEIQTGKQDRGFSDSELISAVCNTNSWYSGNARHDLMSCLSGDCNINLSSSGTSNDSLQALYRDAAVPPEGLELVVWSCVNRTSQSDKRASSTGADDQVFQMITPQARNIFQANFNQ